MELQTLISEVLTIATIGLMGATVAIPLSALIRDTAGKRMPRRWVEARRVPGGTAAASDAVPELDRHDAPGRAAAAPATPRRTAPKRRAQKRLRTCLLGSLHTGTVTRADNLCDLVDLSAGGARVRLVDPMARFSRITLGLRYFGYFPARVVWRDGDEVGLEFDADPHTVVARMRGLLPRPAPAGAF